jgi:hypothetical protein
MPSKPRTLAGILRLRRHADRAYNLVQRDPATARIHGSARWQEVRAQVLRDEPVCCVCAWGTVPPRTSSDCTHAGPPGQAGRKARVVPSAYSWRIVPVDGPSPIGRMAIVGDSPPQAGAIHGSDVGLLE